MDRDSSDINVSDVVSESDDNSNLILENHRAPDSEVAMEASGNVPQEEPSPNVLDSGTSRKQYECRKCGQPLKGHVCNHKSLHRRQRRYVKHPLFRDDEPSFARSTMANSGEDLLFDTDDESSWDKDRDTREVWSKKSSNKNSSGNRRVGLERSIFMRRKLSVLSDFDKEPTSSLLFGEKNLFQHSSSGRRTYLCRKCGVPRKGHVCPHDASQKQKGSLTDNVSPAHILMEEIRIFLQEHSRADRGTVSSSKDYETEKKLLQTWAANVYNKISHEKERVDNNDQRIAKRKSLAKSINKERDAMIALRSRIRQIQNDCRILEERLVESRQESGAYVGASSFLNAIDTLR